MTITVRYWRGTQQCEAKARSYRGAMRIAARNQNAYGPTYWDPDGRQLHDLGCALVYYPEDDGEIVLAVA